MRAEPIRIEVGRYHFDRAQGRGIIRRGYHEYRAGVRRGTEQLSNPDAYGHDLRDCVVRAVARARATIRCARTAPATGWPACGELEAAHG